MLSNKTKYGIKALLYIYNNSDKDKKPIPISKIALDENIPRKFLESILLTLRNGKILGAKQGKYGGYYLMKNAEDIYMKEVLRILDGPIAMIPCVSLNFYESCADCPDEEYCGVHGLMLEVRNSVLKVLNHKSLAQLAKENK